MKGTTLKDFIGPLVLVTIVVLFMWFHSCSVDKQFDYLYNQQQQQLGEK